MSDVNINFPPAAAPTRALTAGEVEDMVIQAKADVEGQVSAVVGQVEDTATDLEHRGVNVYKFIDLIPLRNTLVRDEWDWTLAIQAAIDFASGEKKPVVFPGGKYKTTDTLVINTSNVKLIGQDMGLTEFNFYGESKPFLSISEVYGYYLENFTVINKNTASQNVGISITNGIMGYIQKVHTNSFYIHVDVVEDSWINRFINFYMSYGNTGIKFGLNTNQTVLDNCAIRHMDNAGVWVAACNGLTISKTDLETCRVGVLVAKNTLYPRAEVYSLNIDGCYTEGNLDGFLRVEGPSVKGRINLTKNFVTTGAYRGDMNQLTKYAVNVTGLTGTDVIEIMSENNSFRYNDQSLAVFNGDGFTKIISINDWSEANIPFSTGVGSFIREKPGYGETDIEVKTGSSNGKYKINGFIVNSQGLFTEKPATPVQGQSHFANDSSLKKPYWFRGSTWVDATGSLSSGYGNATMNVASTSTVVTHNLTGTPTTINITPHGNIGNFWVSNITATQFTINCSVAPVGNTVVSWHARV